MATITVTPGHTYGTTDTVTSTNLNDLGSPTAALTAGSILTADIADGSITVAKLATAVLELSYPIGSIYTNASDSTNPSSILGFGTWTAFGTGQVLVGLDAGQAEFDTLGESGGAKTHTLSEGELPNHTHDVSLISRGGNSAGIVRSPAWCSDDAALPAQSVTSLGNGGDQPHNNLQPYIVVHMWKRTA
jgi:hypothetical protein